MGALKKDSLPDSANTELGSTVHDTAPSSVPGRAEATANDAYGFLPSDLPNRDAVADVLRGLKDGQDDPWAPTPEFTADSAGAEFAAYQARHAPAVRHETPTPAGAAVILNVTEPLPAPAPSVGVTPPDSITRERLPAHAPAADVTQLDLATLIERAKVREEAASDGSPPRDERAAEMTLKLRRGSISPRTLRTLQITVLGLGVLLLLGVVYVFALSGPSSNPPAGASSVASSATVAPAVGPSRGASAAPAAAAPTSPTMSSAPAVVTPARRPEPPASLVSPVPILSARPRPHGLPGTSSVVPTAEPKRDAAPKNDFVW